jgi:hypothetical protein
MMASSLTFQVVDWLGLDHRTEVVNEAASSSGSSDDGYGERRKPVLGPAQYVIQMFGRTAEGRAVKLDVTGWKPFFYVRLPASMLHPTKMQPLAEPVRAFQRFLSTTSRGALAGTKIVRRKPMVGFLNGETRYFLRAEFHTIRGMRACDKQLRGEDGGGDVLFVPGAGHVDLEGCLYESRVEPLLRFAHAQDLPPCGWVSVQGRAYRAAPPACKLAPHEDAGALHVTADWTNVRPTPSEAIPMAMAPIVLASFDLECASSHGDFPAPTKTYLKVARELHALLQRGELALDAVAVRDALVGALHPSDPYGPLSRAYAKDSARWTADRLVDVADALAPDLLAVLTDSVTWQQHSERLAHRPTNAFALMMASSARSGPAPPARQSMSRRGGGSAKAQHKHAQATTTHTSAAERIEAATALLDERLPPLEGDPIIQIGVVFQALGGTTADLERHVFTLGTCSAIPGVHVVQCRSERELLERWADLMRVRDPDLVTGYNVFGFDFWYTHERAQETGAWPTLERALTRLPDGGGPQTLATYDVRQLSSSALGDNELRLLRMPGRVIFDLMKVVQRDQRLDSYRLDAVANAFLRGRVTRVDADGALWLPRAGANAALEEGAYVRLPGFRGAADKHRVVSYDAETGRVQLDPPAIGGGEGNDAGAVKEWQLSKDDIGPKQIFACQRGTADDRALVAKYCVQDCALVLRIIARLSVFHGNAGMANVCCVPLSFIFLRGQGVKVHSLVVKQCAADGFVAPTLKPPPDPDAVPVPKAEGDEEDEEQEDEGYEGAIVLVPEPGIYTDMPVAVLDYASLYPSSMISENISHDTLVQDDAYANVPGVEYVDISFDRFGADGKPNGLQQTCRFAQTPEGGLMPRILKRLLAARKETRKRMKTVEDDPEACAVLDGLQLAYKITANSVYGQLGARTSPVYLKECAACTTATGRKMILMAKAFLEEQRGARVVYGDTGEFDFGLVFGFVFPRAPNTPNSCAATQIASLRSSRRPWRAPRTAKRRWRALLKPQVTPATPSSPYCGNRTTWSTKKPSSRSSSSARSGTSGTFTSAIPTQNL